MWVELVCMTDMEEPVRDVRAGAGGLMTEIAERIASKG